MSSRLLHALKEFESSNRIIAKDVLCASTSLKRGGIRARALHASCTGRSGPVPGDPPGAGRQRCAGYRRNFLP
jgi:hypothetical protein